MVICFITDGDTAMIGHLQGGLLAAGDIVTSEEETKLDIIQLLAVNIQALNPGLTKCLLLVIYLGLRDKEHTSIGPLKEGDLLQSTSE